mgnify:CR=1 FL=1
MNVLLTIIVLVWIARIIHNTLAFVELWWVKEYRWDRMLVHLKTDQGKHMYILPFRGLRISPKTIGLVIISLAVLVLLFFALPFHVLIRLLLLDIISFPLTAILVFLIGIPQWLYHRVIIEWSTQKLRSHKNLFVIGITGSYGKTSTKEYLATILSTKYKVLKTEKSQNSLIGIAETIFRELRSEHEVFIVEMGAYKIGEIAEMSKMVQPQIGIITAINEQHQDLFGSIENTMKAKYELIAGLSGKRIAVMTDGYNLTKLIEWAKRDKLDLRGPHITDVSQKTDGVSFHLNSTPVHAPVIGIHQAHNIALAITAAVAAGMTLVDATKATEKIIPIDGMMKPVKGINGSTFIDDTFNNNPDGAIAAINYLATTRGKKILVFQPMIELGVFAQSAHERVGKRAAEVCDTIILTNKNYLKFFPGNVYGPKEASDYIRRNVSSADTVLFKGKEAQNVLRLLV